MKSIKIKDLNLNRYSVGFALVCIYILMSYIAHDFLIPSVLLPISLYPFLLISAYVFLRDFRKTRLTDFTKWYIVFIIFSALILLYSPSIAGVFDTFYQLIVSFFVVSAVQIYLRTEKNFLALCWCYAISSGLLVFLLYITGNLKGSESDRLGEALMGNANNFAMIMMIALMCCFWLLIHSAKKMRWKLLLVAIILADLYALSLSGGRKFLVVPFIFLYLVLWFKRDKNGKRQIFLYTVIFAIVVIVAGYLIMKVPVLYNAIGVRMEKLFQFFIGNGGDNSSMIREEMRILAFSEWLDRPFWGYGFDSFKYLAQEELGQFYYSHCNYTELLYCGGIFYFLVFYWQYFKIAYRSIADNLLPDKYKAFSFGAVISLFIFDYGAVSYNLTPYMILLMMAFSALRFRQTEKTENKE
ncbi:MAG: O-antigen ligase family protein [Clostridia bacterium]|nr:O-antigen ligase family protein [Clostridia bacterium]